MLRAAQAVHLDGCFVVDVVVVWRAATVDIVPAVRSAAMRRARSSSIFALGTFLMSWYWGLGR